MDFLLYRYLSSLKEEELIKLLLKDSSQKEFMDLSGTKQLKDQKFFKTFYEERRDERKEYFVNHYSLDCLKGKYPTLESEAEKDMFIGLPLKIQKGTYLKRPSIRRSYSFW
jgi:hypothetical protein